MQFLQILILTFSLFIIKSDEYILYKSIPVSQVQYFTTDNLGNTYFIENNVLRKLDSRDGKLYNFSEKNIGNLSMADATNALRILLLYPDFNLIKILDSKLAPTSTVDLRQINIFQPKLITNSYNDCIWVYDQQDFRLKRINPSLQIVNESPNLKQLLNIELKPNYLIENSKWLYLNDPNNGIIIFDFFGTYYKTLPIKGIKSFQIIGDEIIYFSNKDSIPSFKRYNLNTQIEKDILLPALQAKDSLIDARLAQGKLFLFKKELIDLYRF